MSVLVREDDAAAEPAPAHLWDEWVSQGIVAESFPGSTAMDLTLELSSDAEGDESVALTARCLEHSGGFESGADLRRTALGFDVESFHWGYVFVHY